MATLVIVIFSGTTSSPFVSSPFQPMYIFPSARLCARKGFQTLKVFEALDVLRSGLSCTDGIDDFDDFDVMNTIDGSYE